MSSNKISNKKQWHAKTINLGTTIIVSFITLVIGLSAGLNWINISNSVLPYFGLTKNTQNNWHELDPIISRIKDSYDGDIDSSALIEGAKKGITAALNDEYTVYMDKAETSDFQKSLHGDIGAGIGVEIGLRENYVRVLRTLPDNPARKAGVLAGDIVYKINDEEVYNLSAEAIAQKIRGEAGTSVTVTFVRDGKEQAFTMTREKINNISAILEYSDDTAIITISRFDSDTGALVQKYAQEFTAKGVKKVILDLRGNGGGYVSAAQDLLSLWLDSEPILVQKSKHFGEDTASSKHGQAILANTKTIVLVNGATASASEMVAGALQDYEKATVIGEKTFGKGVVQTMFNLDSGAMLKITTAHWYTPKGKSIHKKGIKPDQIVHRSFEDINANHDPQLDAALKQ